MDLNRLSVFDTKRDNWRLFDIYFVRYAISFDYFVQPSSSLSAGANFDLCYHQGTSSRDARWTSATSSFDDERLLLIFVSAFFVRYFDLLEGTIR